MTGNNIDESIRDYYISKLRIFVSGVETWLYPEAHYEFSSSDISSDRRSFLYSSSINVPFDFALNGEYEIFLNSELSEFDNCTVRNDDYFSVISSDGNSVVLKCIKEFGSDFAPNITFEFSTAFPLSQLNGIEFILNVSDLGSDNIKSFVEKRDVEFLGPSEVTSVNSEIEGPEDNEEEAIYLRANQKNILSIDCGSTFYRLDSSASGEGYYQTLSSLYFTIPAEYMDGNDTNKFNDRIVSEIEITYDSFYTKPGIYTSEEEVYNKLKSNLRKPLADNFYLSGAHIKDNASSVPIYLTELLVGDSIIEGEFLWGLITYTQCMISATKKYDTFDYLFLVKPFKEFETVMSAQSFLNEIKNNRYLDNDTKTTIHEVLRFDSSYDLLAFKDQELGDIVSDLGLARGLWFYLIENKDNFMDSVSGAEAILTLSPEEVKSALALSDEEFCDEYLVSMTDYLNCRERMMSAVAKNEYFVFCRYDVYDYYASPLETNLMDDVENTQIFRTKYYEGIDILALSASNSIDTKVYSVAMSPIDAVHDITTGKPTVSLDEKLDLWALIQPILSIILVVGLVVVVFNVGYKLKVYKAISGNSKKK